MASSRKNDFIKAFLRAEGISVEYADVNKVNNDFVKKLRKKLNMSQSIFATILGVTKKTIEKWEQGANPIKGCSARLLYLIDRNPVIINQLYQTTVYNYINEFTVSIKSQENCNIISYDDFQEFKSNVSNYKIANNFEIDNDVFLSESCC